MWVGLLRIALVMKQLVGTFHTTQLDKRREIRAKERSSITRRGVAVQHVVVLQCNKQHKVSTADSRTVGLKKHKGEAEAAYNREYL